MTDARVIPAEPTYAVIGSGAVGAYYGGCLQKLGRDVHYLCRSGYTHVKEHGWRIDSVNGDFTLPNVKAYGNVTQMPKCDVVIVALKTHHNHLLAELLPPVLKEDGVVLLLQNGLGIEREVARIVGNERVTSGLCFICSNRIGPGHIHHLDYGRVEFADYMADQTPAGITPRIRTIANDFEQAGNDVLLNEDLVSARWRKLVWNIPFNGLTVTLNTDTASIMVDPTHRAHAHALMREVQKAAKACSGRVIEDDFIEMMMDWTDKMAPYLPSMKLDHDAGRALEVEAIFGEPCRAAERAGCDTPELHSIYYQLLNLRRD